MLVRSVATLSSPQRLVWPADMVDNMASFKIRQGDTGRPLVVLLKNQDGSDAVIPPGSTCQFSMVNRQTGHAVSGAALLGNGPNSVNGNQATYPFLDPADTAQAGLYDAEWLVTYPSASTAVAAGSDGVALPQSTINVADATSLPSSGAAQVGSYGYVQYAATTLTSLTGCVGGVGTMTAGDAVVIAGGAETFPTDSRGPTGYTVIVTTEGG